jgi:hypothetical protein
VGVKLTGGEWSGERPGPAPLGPNAPSSASLLAEGAPVLRAHTVSQESARQ